MSLAVSLIIGATCLGKPGNNIFHHLLDISTRFTVPKYLSGQTADTEGKPQ